MNWYFSFTFPYLICVIVSSFSQVLFNFQEFISFVSQMSRKILVKCCVTCSWKNGSYYIYFMTFWLKGNDSSCIWHVFRTLINILGGGFFQNILFFSIKLLLAVTHFHKKARSKRALYDEKVHILRRSKTKNRFTFFKVLCIWKLSNFEWSEETHQVRLPQIKLNWYVL